MLEILSDSLKVLQLVTVRSGISHVIKELPRLPQINIPLGKSTRNISLLLNFIKRWMSFLQR